MPAYGATPAGFTTKPLSQIISDLTAAIQAELGADLDLSPQTPDGQILGIFGTEIASMWELAQIAYNQFNREDTEGAGLDNVGDLTGTPRAGATYTQVYCRCWLDKAHAPYIKGSLVANVSGQTEQQFANAVDVTADMITGSVPSANAVVLFASTTIGPTPAVNANTLNEITNSVSGWTIVNNDEAQTQLGTESELDPDYMLRQENDLAASGSCDPAATAEAIAQAGEAATPPVTLSVQVLENPSWVFVVINGVGLWPHSYAVIIYESPSDSYSGGWLLSTAGLAAIGQALYRNKPAGMAPVGNVLATVTDAVLGQQTVAFLVPTQLRLRVSATITARSGVDKTKLALAVQQALVVAATAPTPPNGEPPNGQLVPGQKVSGWQLGAVIMSVPGVFEITALTFDFQTSPTNTADLPVAANQVATIDPSTYTTDVLISVN